MICHLSQWLVSITCHRLIHWLFQMLDYGWWSTVVGEIDAVMSCPQSSTHHMESLCFFLQWVNGGICTVTDVCSPLMHSHQVPKPQLSTIMSRVGNFTVRFDPFIKKPISVSQMQTNTIVQHSWESTESPAATWSRAQLTSLCISLMPDDGVQGSLISL